MKAFRMNWAVFQICGICPITLDASKSIEAFARIFAIFNVTAELLSVSSSLTFGISNLGADLEGSVHALCHQAAAAITVLYMIFVSFLKRQQIISFFEKTQELCDTNGKSVY